MFPLHISYSLSNYSMAASHLFDTVLCVVYSVCVMLGDADRA